MGTPPEQETEVQKDAVVARDTELLSKRAQAAPQHRGQSSDCSQPTWVLIPAHSSLLTPLGESDLIAQSFNHLLCKTEIISLNMEGS